MIKSMKNIDQYTGALLKGDRNFLCFDSQSSVIR